MTLPNTPHFDPIPVQEWIAQEISAGRIMGCALEVIRQGNTVFEQCFGCKTAGGDPVTPDTQYWIASMTKPIVSVAALHLIQNGALSLTAPVSRFIPGLGDAGVISAGGIQPVSRPATILDLLTHTSGVTYGQFGEGALHDQYAAARVFDYTASNADMGQRLARLPLMHQPGTVFEYGMSTDLLGRVIEVVTGASLEAALNDIVFAPLGMHDTGFVPIPERVAELPVSAIQKSVAPDFTTPSVWQSGGAGLFSTVPDFIRFTRMLRGGGQWNGACILDPETMAMMVQQHLPKGVGYGEYTPALGITAPWPQNGLGFGLGLAVRLNEVDEIPGGVGEFLWPGVSGGNFWVDPKTDLITVFLTHAPLYRTQHRIGLRKAVYAGLSAGDDGQMPA